MILTNRLFEREAPGREAKSIYIFCEGAKREYQYFEYFKEMDSRINVEVYKLHPHEDNSPLGLLNIAEECIIKSEKNPNPKYAFQENDEVWIVLDTDKDKDKSRQPQIKEVKDKCDKPHFEGDENCTNWKKLVNDSIKGGFDSKRHPICIETAQKNAEKNYESSNEGVPDVGSTEAFRLSKSIFPLVETKIKRILASWEISCKQVE